MSNISKRRKEGSKAKIKSMGDHQEFLKRITKTLYYGELPTLPCLSLPVTEISCEVWSVSQRGRSLRRLHADAAAGLARSACVSPCALVLALLYLERLNACNPDYIAATAPADLFLVSLMVGNKFLQDDGEDDEVICSEWAASGGIELDQLKKLELEFLNAIDWNVFVSEKSFEAGLRRLERRVALKQARLHGFFTYTDLSSASAGALLHAVAALALALAALASTLALLASAPLLARLAASSLVSPFRPSDASSLTSLPADISPADHARSLGNLTLDDPSPSDRLRCCTAWATYRDRVSEAPSREAPLRNFFDGLVLYDWKSFEPWWSRTSVLNWLYHSSLVDPMRRWLEKIDGSAPPGRAPAPAPCRDCIRQWLNLSKLNVLVASVYDH